MKKYLYYLSGATLLLLGGCGNNQEALKDVVYTSDDGSKVEVKIKYDNNKHVKVISSNQTINYDAFLKNSGMENLLEKSGMSITETNNDFISNDISKDDIKKALSSSENNLEKIHGITYKVTFGEEEAQIMFELNLDNISEKDKEKIFPKEIKKDISSLENLVKEIEKYGFKKVE